MPEPGLARRYAVALFAAAKKRGAIDEVVQGLEAVVKLLEREPALREFLLSPQVLDEHKEEIVTRALGSRLHPLLLHALHFLLERRRFDHLELIHQNLVELVDDHRGIVKAVVTTAIELEPALQDRLRQRLEATTGKTIRLEPRVDQAILGGAVVVMGDQLIDGSVQTEMRRMRDELMAARVIG